MRVICKCSACQFWDEDGGDFINEGGCSLEEITIDDILTGSGFHPICADYEEKEQ